MEILIYTKRKCPNCITAKMILRAENIRYVEIDVESNPALLSDLPENSRQTPQIFVDGQHVGGLQVLLENEKLARGGGEGSPGDC